VPEGAETTVKSRSRPERPAGLRAVAGVFAILGLYLLVCAALVSTGKASFTVGAWLLGGVETMGPVAYCGIALLGLALAAGLFAMQNWARGVALVVCGLVFFLTIPTISGAVAYARVGGVACQGVKMIVCVVVFRYLYRPFGEDEESLRIT
jgi:hypothetical protein